jgi:HK97 family phage portal protein
MIDRMSLDPRAFGNVHTATDGRDILHNDPDGWEVEQPWLWWDGPANGDGTGGPWGNPPPGAEYGTPSMKGTAIPAATRCTQLIAGIAGFPWKVYRGREQLTTPSWITDPQGLTADGRRRTGLTADVKFSGVSFWKQHIVSYLNWGEGITYTPRVRDADGEPTGPIIAPIYNLHPEHVEVDGGKYYVEDETSPDGYLQLDPRELIVTRNIMRPGRERGLGAIQAHAYDLGFASDIRSYTDNLFQRGIPNGYLKSTKPDLDQVTANKLKTSWMSQHGGVKKSIAVLNATTDFNELNLDPQAVQIVELLKLSAWQMCLIYGVPPSRLGINMGGSNTYSNLESENTIYVQDTLMGIGRELEAAIDAALPAGQSMKIDFNSLLRGDTTSRYQAYEIALRAGFMTVDEVRDREDLAPLSSPADLAQPPAAAPNTTPAAEEVA